jgi:hypothetical protein
MVGEGAALKGVRDQGARPLKCPLFRISKVGNPNFSVNLNRKFSDNGNKNVLESGIKIFSCKAKRKVPLVLKIQFIRRGTLAANNL